MPGPLAQHAVKAKADEEGDEREDYDDGQASISILSICPFEHSAGETKIPTAPTHEAAIAPHLCDC